MSRKWIIRAIVLWTILGLSYVTYWVVQQLPEERREIAVAPVRRGEVVIRAYTRGELQAVRSVTLRAPNLFGTVQITRLAQTGSFAKPGDLIVEFDDSEVQARLEEDQLEIEQVRQQIRQLQAELAIRDNQDQVELLRAQYSVRRAELEVQRNELLSAIDARKNLLTLEESRQRLKELQADIESRRKQAEAELAVLQERLRKAELELEQEKARLRQVKLLSPIAGLIAILENRSAGFMFGMEVPDYREGDEVRPGEAIAEILDVSEMELVAKVSEVDRANLREGQQALVRLDAVPDVVIPATVKNLSVTASVNVFSGDPTKKFDVRFALDMKKLLEAVGATPEQISQLFKQREQLRQAELARARPPEGPRARGMRAQQAQAGEGAQAAGREGGERRAQFRAQIEKILKEEFGGKSIEELSAEERRKLFQRMRSQFGAGRAGRAGGQEAAEGGEAAAERRGRFAEAGPGFGGALGRAGGGPPQLGFGPTGGELTLRWTDEQLARAQLPPPPEEGKLEILLRPGLLADVEVVVEKIPDAIYIPNQALFERDGKPIVFVKVGERFEERVVKPIERSESVVVIAEGLREGEVVALENPFPTGTGREQRQSAEPKPSAPGGMPGMGGGRRGGE